MSPATVLDVFFAVRCSVLRSKAVVVNDDEIGEALPPNSILALKGENVTAKEQRIHVVTAGVIAAAVAVSFAAAVAVAFADAHSRGCEADEDINKKTPHPPLLA